MGQHVIGIDLGTTNSCVAVVDGGVPIVVPNRGGYKTTPSMVAVTDAGKRLVGHIAKRQAITNAENTVHAAKRLIGRKWGSPQVQNALITASYKIVQGPHGDLRIRLRDKDFSIPEVSSMILQEMKIVAEDYLGESVRKAVITVPAYFNDNQRQATKDAGAIAGLDVIRIINEPTAAALAYGFGKKLDQTVAIYDLGGGTFDVSVMVISKAGVFRVVSTTGDTYLGGEDFDERVIEWLVEGFEKEHGVDLRKDRMALQRLRDAAESAKCQLSSVTETEINLPFIYSSGDGQAGHLQRVLTRETLEALTEDLVERTLGICQEALEDAKLGKDEIDEVILVGGMTRMPAIQAAVSDFFGRIPSKNVHPDEVVALGAALQGAALLKERDDTVLLDVTPHALGIVTYGEVFEELIERNTTVPASQTKVFTTSRDNQTTVRILVMQGDSKHPDENEFLGEFHLAGLRKARRGELKVEVTFAIDTNGIVSVSAKDLETGQAQSITIAAKSGLTVEELDSMIKSARGYLMERRKDEELEAMTQKVETLMAQIERMLPDVEALTGTGDLNHEALTKARQTIDQVRRLIRNDRLEELPPLAESLERMRKTFKGVLAGPRAHRLTR